MTAEINNREVLNHGEYKVKVKQLDSNNNIVLVEKIVKPLTYNELADGWLRVTPKMKNIIHHFSIYLSQLPMNLWGKVRKTHTHDMTKDYYKKIKDGNYHYSIKYSTNDEKVFELYRNIMSRTPDLDKIRMMYKELENNRVKGWVMLYTLNMLKQ